MELAAGSDISVLAITDHDTVDGCLPAMASGEVLGVKVISGVELSIDYPLDGNGHLHLLGLFLNPENEELVKTLNDLKEARQQRAQEILYKLNKIGMPIDPAELEAKVQGASPGRPHIVSLLLEKKYVYNAFQAYTKILGRGGSAYVPKKKLDLQTAIESVHQAGGLAILAHPISLMFANYPLLGDEILRFQKMGLDGVEVFYSSHDHYFTKWLYDFCKKHYLLISGGSDFHGKAKRDIALGRGRGNLKIPVSVFETLEEAWINRSNSK